MKTRTFINAANWKPLAAIAIATGLSLGPAGLRADTEWEYEADEGYHEEEWSDPSDWINEDLQTSYETDYYDTWDYDYDYGYDGTWDDDYGYDYGYYDTWDDDPWVYDPTPGYYWDEAENEWVSTAPSYDNEQWNRSDTNQQANRNNQADRNKQANRAQSRDKAGKIQNARFEGRIEGFRSVNLKSKRATERHSFVKIRLQNDQSRVVSLGTNVDMNQLDLEKGERIKVSGRVIRVADKKVLLADRIQVGDKTFRVKDRNQLDPRGNTASRGARSMPLEGRIDDFRRVNLGGSRDRNLIVRLQLKDGTKQIVDLGNNTLGDFGLERGDRVLINGERRNIKGHSVVVARGISVDGERTRIRRSETEVGDRINASRNN
jgi:hypothetical protein